MSWVGQDLGTWQQTETGMEGQLYRQGCVTALVALRGEVWTGGQTVRPALPIGIVMAVEDKGRS